MNPTQSGPVRETEINRVIMKLNKSVDLAKKEFDDLNVYLSPVLRTGVPGQIDKVAEPEFNTKLAKDINSVVTRIDQLGYFILETRNQLEL